jgi:hypothetical protein
MGMRTCPLMYIVMLAMFSLSAVFIIRRFFGGSVKYRLPPGALCRRNTGIIDHFEHSEQCTLYIDLSVHIFINYYIHIFTCSFVHLCICAYVHMCVICA